MDLDGFRRVMRRNQTFMLALMLAIFLPFMVLIGFTASSPAKAAFGLGLFGVIIVLLLVVMLVAGRGGRTTPTIVHVTNRRILVENTGKGESSGSISLDSLGDVVLESKGAAKSAGLSWVFLLPLGTTTLRIGSGRVQMLAPGVLVIPAVSTVRAEELRSYVLERARALQAAPAPSAPLA